MASDKVEGYGIHILLEDLLIEIFLRSPVKSLLRAKCVCKHWYRLIKNHIFNHKYLEYQKNTKPNRLLLQYFNDEAQELNYTVLDDINQSSTTYHTLEHLHVKNILRMEGPINGVYCLHTFYSRIVLWNPALMEFKILPLPPPYFLPHYRVCSGLSGFGIDPLTNDHKVILFRRFGDLIDPVDENPIVTLYNLTTNTWRHLDLGDINLCDSRVAQNNSSSFISGTYYWWVDSGVVLAFDMGNETFRVISGPDISEFNNVVLLPGSDTIEFDSVDLCYYYSIALYEERVALVRHKEWLVNIWVMLEEGIWIKQFSIGPLPGLRRFNGFWKNEGIFLVIDDSELSFRKPNYRLVLYDVNTQEMRNVGPRATNIGFGARVYYESLVSINGGINYNRDMVSAFLNEYRNHA